MDSYSRVDSELRAEADSLIHRNGVGAILREYGDVYVGGSYALHLMTWRDLDIYLKAPDLPVERFLDLGHRIGALLMPWKMSFTNHREFPSTEGIPGLYWGIRLGDVKAGAWKIDLWALQPETWQQQIEKVQRLGSQLTGEQRSTILKLKAELWNHPEYRKTISSQDVYDAVRIGGARDLSELWSFVRARSRHRT